MSSSKKLLKPSHLNRNMAPILPVSKRGMGHRRESKVQ
uniref:Uncharacterized protein n=2 Tax=Anguilla anguilla TaxID=7936 RepID=A0A0E9TB44_ANGAN